MKRAAVLALIVVAALGTGCASTEKKAAKAQQQTAATDATQAEAAFVQKRLKLIEEYEACVKKAQGDAAQVEACDSYLKAVEAMK